MDIRWFYNEIFIIDLKIITKINYIFNINSYIVVVYLMARKYCRYIIFCNKANEISFYNTFRNSSIYQIILITFSTWSFAFVITNCNKFLNNTYILFIYLFIQIKLQCNNSIEVDQATCT